MTIKVSKPSINIREKLSELEQDTGLKGQELMRSETVAEARTAIGAGRKNLIINGGFDVWQRGTSFSTNDTYTADRWKINLSGAVGTVTRQEFTLGQTDVPYNPRYFLRTTVATANNNTGNITRLEDVRTTSGVEMTLSFWAKGTNPPAGTFVTMARQSFGSGGSTAIDTTLESGRVLTSSWQRFTTTFTLPSVAGKTIGAGDYTWFEIVKQSDGDTGTAAWQVDIANVQLELGKVATEFEHRSYGEELALCQRYYIKSSGYGSSHIFPCRKVNSSSGGNNTGAQYDIFRITGLSIMRTTPSLIHSNPTLITIRSEAGGLLATATGVPTVTKSGTGIAAVSHNSADTTTATQIRFMEPIQLEAEL